MTMLEKLQKNGWRKARVEEATRNGIPVYVLTHPCGATAVVGRWPADMEVRAWRTWADKRWQEERANGPGKWWRPKEVIA